MTNPKNGLALIKSIANRTDDPKVSLLPAADIKAAYDAIVLDAQAWQKAIVPKSWGQVEHCAFWLARWQHCGATTPQALLEAIWKDMLACPAIANASGFATATGFRASAAASAAMATTELSTRLSALLMVDANG